MITPPMTQAQRDSIIAWKVGNLNLDVNQKELLIMVMGYVNDAHEHRIDALAIEQRLTDMLEEIENLAMEIEKGKYEIEENK